jgi:NADP-dependent 3-hydroxy acid dehydrogenase YdfG
MTSQEQLKRHFHGKTVILTGAASGIGRALALSLAGAGARVHAIDIDREGLDSLPGESGDGGGIATHLMDVRDASAFNELAGQIHHQTKQIDFLFNNAGVTLLGEAHNIPFDRWKWLLDINLMGVVHGILSIYPIMVRQRSGHIINTASIAGATGYATAAAYTTSKAAILELSRSLRSEARGHGVKVSAACPGYVDSGIFAADRIVGADLAAVTKTFPAGMMTPDTAVGHLLRGVISGKPKIIFPFSARFLWTVSTWAPSLVEPFQKRFIKVFRPS